MVGRVAGVTPQVQALPRLVTRALLPALGLFVPVVRGLEENIYIGYEPYIVDHSAYAAAFGDQATSLEDAIAATVSWYSAHSR